MWVVRVDGMGGVFVVGGVGVWFDIYLDEGCGCLVGILFAWNGGRLFVTFEAEDLWAVGFPKKLRMLPWPAACFLLRPVLGAGLELFGSWLSAIVLSAASLADCSSSSFRTRPALLKPDVMVVLLTEYAPEVGKPTPTADFEEYEFCPSFCLLMEREVSIVKGTLL